MPGQQLWRMAAIALLSVRVMQGFIYWGGGSRRFIYAPQKLDPDAHTWLADKLQGAMPGALFGTDQSIAFLLQHFWLLYPAIILFSAAELIAGTALVLGLMTRLSALATIGFSIALMLIFGWQGGTCIDEWTMASCNLAMGATLMLAGCGAYSLDNVLLKRNPGLSTLSSSSLNFAFAWAKLTVTVGLLISTTSNSPPCGRGARSRARARAARWRGRPAGGWRRSPGSPR